MNDADYSHMTDQEFMEELVAIVKWLSTAELFAISGIYEILAEEFNNEVLDAWAEKHPDLAFPNQKEEDNDYTE